MILTYACLAVRGQLVAYVTETVGLVLAVQRAALVTVQLLGLGTHILGCQNNQVIN